jgi:hypothetical protein
MKCLCVLAILGVVVETGVKLLRLTPIDIRGRFKSSTFWQALETLESYGTYAFMNI